MLKITSLHLRSNTPFESARSIAEGTHIQIRFARYDHEPRPGPWSPAQSWNCLVSYEDLFEALQAAGLLEEEA